MTAKERAALEEFSMLLRAAQAIKNPAIFAWATQPAKLAARRETSIKVTFVRGTVFGLLAGDSTAV